MSDLTIIILLTVGLVIASIMLEYQATQIKKLKKKIKQLENTTKTPASI